MGGAEVKAQLFDGRFILKNWEAPCGSNLTEIIETVKHVKQSLNDCLTQLIDSSARDRPELSDASGGEEEAEDDSVSGFIKGITVAHHEPSASEKRKISYLYQCKKIKK